MTICQLSPLGDTATSPPTSAMLLPNTPALSPSLFIPLHHTPPLVLLFYPWYTFIPLTSLFSFTCFLPLTLFTFFPYLPLYLPALLTTAYLFTSSFIPVSCPLSPISCPFLFYQLPPLPSSKPFPMLPSPLKPWWRRHKLNRLDAPPRSRTNISSEGESISIHCFFHPQVAALGWANPVETTVEHLLHLKILRKLLQVILLGMMTQSVMRSTLTLPQRRGLHRGSWRKPRMNLEGRK